ncbi:MAG TPA: TIR domain-containing protein, partial [Roseiflexaceae bacterium]|nr:TIR domain-containing protein [Roseiflexaceae bacterium]
TPLDVPKLQATAAASFKYDVFISYSSADEQWVEHTLLKTLEDAGLRACIDFRDFAVGRPTIINIQEAVQESRHIVLVITQNWIKSEWTLFESLLIRTKDPGSLQRRTIPLRLEPVELPDFISMLSWVDFTRADRHELGWRKLFAALTETASGAEKSAVIEPAATPSGPLPLPPQSGAGSRAIPAAEASTGSTQVSPSLGEVKKQMLNKRLANLMAEYEAINQQIDGALDAGDRLRLKRRASGLEQEISQVESDLRAL